MVIDIDGRRKEEGEAPTKIRGQTIVFIAISGDKLIDKRRQLNVQAKRSAVGDIGFMSGICRKWRIESLMRASLLEPGITKRQKERNELRPVVLTRIQCDLTFALGLLS
jgi:hypothetical protein